MKVELCHIQKNFGKVHANEDIALNILAGTILGILGKVEYDFLAGKFNGNTS
jgi:ABC-type uncharacterized transport system ATPase subunit